MTNLSDLGPLISGKPHGGQDIPEEAHFYPCPYCGHWVDERDFRQVFYHEEPRHEPLEPEDGAVILTFPERPKCRAHRPSTKAGGHEKQDNESKEPQPHRFTLPKMKKRLASRPGQRAVLMGESTEWGQCNGRSSTARFCSTIREPAWRAGGLPVVTRWAQSDVAGKPEALHAVLAARAA
jgi:hypothetical protein